MSVMSSKKKSANDVLAEYQDLPEFCGRPLTQVNQRGSFGDTPLHVASSRGRLDEAEALLNANADVNARGELENTPLHAAAGQGHAAVVNLLLDWGASKDEVNMDGKTARDVALIMHHHHVVAVIDSWKTKKPS